MDTKMIIRRLPLGRLIGVRGQKRGKRSCSVMSDSLRPHRLQLTRLLSSWDFPGMNTGVGCHFLLQGIFPTQGSNLGLPHCRQTLYCPSYQGSQKKGNNLPKKNKTKQNKKRGNNCPKTKKQGRNYVFISCLKNALNLVMMMVPCI